MKKGIIFILIIFLIIAVAVADYCISEKERTIYAMDTVMTIKIKGKTINLDRAEEIIKGIDRDFNCHNENSFIYKINNNEKLFASEDICSVIKTALNYCHITNGAFDITLKEIKDYWESCNEKGIVPDYIDLEKMANNADYSKIVVEDNHILLNENKLDLGGIVKGYATDCVIKMLKENGVKEAVVDLGGNIYAYSKKGLVKVGIQDPVKSRGNIACVLDIKDSSVVTSGTYERYYEIDNKKYHHILNPKTGYPADNGILSVTVMGENSTMCDALSTALLVMGEEKAIEFYKENKNFEFMIIKENKIICSKNFNAYDFAEGYDVEILD